MEGADEQRAEIDAGAAELELESAAYAQLIAAPIGAFVSHCVDQGGRIPQPVHNFVLDVMAARDEVVRDYLQTGHVPKLEEVVAYIRASRFHCDKETLEAQLADAEQAFM